MRNSELDRMQVKDIIRISQRRFINIPKSKTRYGARMVPLHDFAYGKLIRYIGRNKKGPEDLLFCQPNGKALPRQRYANANIALGAIAGHDKARLKKESITFYSGRHFYKTMMNAGGLGEVEEYFMGHKVSNDVAKRYNHRDKQGQEKIAAKAREALRILDRALFAPRR
jgi:integrase